MFESGSTVDGAESKNSKFSLWYFSMHSERHIAVGTKKHSGFDTHLYFHEDKYYACVVK